MLFGYNTNGFAHHRLEDALAIIAELGYGSVALTLDHHALNPFEADLLGRTAEVRHQLEKHLLRCVVETGARFLLDPRRKHQPTLISARAEDRQARLDFLCRSCDIAADLGADAVSFWSGTADDAAGAEEWSGRLLDGCRRLCDHAQARGVRLAFEPEPGMFIDRLAKFAALREDLNCPHFGLTLDVGHLHCQGELPIEDHVYQWRKWLWNVHIEDMRRGVHDHLMFGEGDIDFPPLLACLQEIGYTGGVHVELSRHSHDAVETARRAMAFLRPLDTRFMADIKLQNVSKVYDNGVRAVAEVNLEVHDGELLVLVGPSGCGKTTTLRLIAGLEQPTTGSIHIGGRSMADVPCWQRDLAMVFQKPALVPSKTVRRNLNFGNELRRGFLDWFSLAHRKQRRGQENEALEGVARMLDLLDVLDRKPAELSGGQLQRVALGRTLLRQPAARLLDEPLGQLDGPLRRQLRRELHLLHRQFPATMIHVTHDSEEALALGDRIAVLNDGVLLQVDAAGTLLNRPRHRFVAEFFPTEVGPMSFLAGRIVAESGAVVQAARLHESSAGEPPVPRIVFQIGDRKLAPPPSRRAVWQKNVGGRVCLGVRPDDVSIQCSGSSAADAWPMQVLLLEPWLHGTLVTCTDEVTRVTGFVAAARTKDFVVGGRAWVEFRLDRALLFDGDTGVTLELDQ